MKKQRWKRLKVLLFTILIFLQSKQVFAQMNEERDDPEYWKANNDSSENMYEEQNYNSISPFDDT